MLLGLPVVPEEYIIYNGCLNGNLLKLISWGFSIFIISSHKSILHSIDEDWNFCTWLNPTTLFRERSFFTIFSIFKSSGPGFRGWSVSVSYHVKFFILSAFIVCSSTVVEVTQENDNPIVNATANPSIVSEGGTVELDGSDINNDGNVDVLDIIQLVYLILNN